MKVYVLHVPPESIAGVYESLTRAMEAAGDVEWKSTRFADPPHYRGVLAMGSVQVPVRITEVEAE